MESRGSHCIGGYISQGILQSNQQKTIQPIPTLNENIGPRDKVDLVKVGSDDLIFDLKRRFSVDIKDEPDVSVSEKSNCVSHNKNTGLVMDIDNLLSIDTDNTIDTAKLNESGTLLPQTPAAEAALLTAQSILEKDLVDVKKDKYTGLKKCPVSSMVIPGMQGFDNMADIVVKNNPLLIPVE